MSMRSMRLKLAIFGLLAALGITYVAASYVGVGRMLGLSGYTVTATLPRTGGLFQNGEVTYRGVPVGRVAHLEAGPDGVRASLLITSDVPIPRDVQAVVRNRSAIGEQYLDLRPSSDAGPYLAGGDTIAVTDSGLPVRLNLLLQDMVDLSDSLPTHAMKRVVDEMYDASAGSATDLRSLLQTSTRFARLADANAGPTLALIKDVAPVLRTQQLAAGSIVSSSSSLRAIAATLAGSDRALRQAILQAPGAALQVQQLFADVGQPMTILLRDLLSLNGALAPRSRDLERILSTGPRVVGDIASTLRDGAFSMGLTTNFTEPLPCQRGYTQPRRAGLETGDVPLLLTGGCTAGPRRGAASAR
ncbi:MlaD family protein [Nocardioides ultimimeridianus]